MQGMLFASTQALLDAPVVWNHQLSQRGEPK